MVITETALTKMHPGKERIQVLDKKLTGFGVRIQSADEGGRKSFFWRAKVNGRQVFRALGEFPATKVDKARTAALELAGKAAEWKRNGYAGDDPFQKKKRQEPVAVPTFKALVEAYIQDQVRPNANHPDDAEYDVRWKVKRHFSGPDPDVEDDVRPPSWLDRKVDSITVEDVLAVKNECGQRHHLANRATEFVRTLYAWSAKSKNEKINFWPVDNPAKSVELHDEKPRERFMEPDELVRFNKALDSEPCPDLKDFLILAINTGARRSDLFGMRWTDIHWERETWTVPYPKNGESYDVALLPAALAVLERRRAQTPESEVFVFPSWGDSGHLTDLKKPWQAFRERAGIPDIRVHDIRRSVGSYLPIAGESLQQIGAALGHKSLASTAIYAKLHSQAVRAARENGQATMVQMMKAAKKRGKLTAKPRKLLSAVAS